MANNATKPDSQSVEKETYAQLPLVKINFILMGVAALMIVIGFLLIAGGAPADSHTFNPEVFSTRRIVVGPTLAFLGFIFMGVAIMWPSPKKNKSDKAE